MVCSLLRKMLKKPVAILVCLVSVALGLTVKREDDKAAATAGKPDTPAPNKCPPKPESIGELNIEKVVPT
jgi:hypothetical protein